MSHTPASVNAQPQPRDARKYPADDGAGGIVMPCGSGTWAPHAGHTPKQQTPCKPKCPRNYTWTGATCELEDSGLRLLNRGNELYFSVTGDVARTAAVGGLAVKGMNLLVDGGSKVAKWVAGYLIESNIEHPCDQFWDVYEQHVKDTALVPENVDPQDDDVVPDVARHNKDAPASLPAKGDTCGDDSDSDDDSSSSDSPQPETGTPKPATEAELDEARANWERAVERLDTGEGTEQEIHDRHAKWLCLEGIEPYCERAPRKILRP